MAISGTYRSNIKSNYRVLRGTHKVTTDTYMSTCKVFTGYVWI